MLSKYAPILISCVNVFPDAFAEVIWTSMSPDSYNTFAAVPVFSNFKQYVNSVCRKFIGIEACTESRQFPNSFM